MMTKPSIRSLSICLVLGLCPILFSGCHLGIGASARTDQSRLEAQLRTRESSITKLENQVTVLRDELQASLLEVAALRKSFATNDGADRVILSEEAQSTFRIKTVEISSFLSGGLDRDATPGDEILSVLLTPRDSSGEVLRADGSIEMTVYDLSRPSQQQLIGSWTFDTATTREQWHSGVIGKGFHVNVEWKTPPLGEEVFVHCRFTTTDDRAFDTNSTISVTPESGPISPAPTTKKSLSL
jgi:hypothetical protein